MKILAKVVPVVFQTLPKLLMYYLESYRTERGMGN